MRPSKSQKYFKTHQKTNLGYYDGPMLSLILRTGTPIISIDYQLSPEKIYPSAIHECENVVKEIYERKYVEYGIDREKITLIGDSAGGNITAVICQRLLREKLNYIKVSPTAFKKVINF